MKITGRRSIRDRLGSALRDRPVVTAIELLILPLGLGLQAAGVVPKPKLPLLLLAWLSMWLRRVSWRSLGLTRPKRWAMTLLAAALIGVAYDALDITLFLPLLHRLTGEPIDLAQFDALRGNAGMLATLVLASWVSAALIEELLYRGYYLNRLEDLLGRSAPGRATAVALVTAAFAFAHHAQGVTGVADNLLAGLLFAGLYLASGRNLWLPILVHGVIDTASVVLLYFGYRP